MTLIFVATTSALLALDATWSAHFMYSTKMDAINAFLEHETQEFAHDVMKTDGSLEQIKKVAEDIASVSHEPPCAFRIRNEDGDVLAKTGDGRLLALPYPHRSGWRDIIFGSQSSSLAIEDDVYGYRLEVLADVHSNVAALIDYLVSATIAFLVSVALAGLAGWYGANRGLRGLREVVRGAGDIVFPTGGVSLDLDGAPREVRDVGVALEAMIKRVDSGMDNMRTFTAGLAHELRSPLQSLIGRTEVALLKQRPADEYEQALRGNLDDLHSLSDSVDNMVALCRSASPKRQIHPTHHFDLAEESQLRLERERSSAERAGISVLFSSEGDTHLTADRESLLRVVRNLVSNAIQWTPAGRTVRVAILGQTNTVDIEVIDQGPGIPDEMAAKMFTAFVTGMQRVGRRSGYGLGLAICKSVVDEHYGRIEFRNQPEGGARFYVTIPRSPPRQPGDNGSDAKGRSNSLARDAGAVIGRGPTALLLACTLLLGCAGPGATSDAAFAPVQARPDVKLKSRIAANYEIPDVVLQDQHGRDRSLPALLDSGHPVVMNFVFTTCTTICPVMTATFSQVSESMQTDRADLEFVSISLDPEYDTPEVLAAYAQRFGGPDSWTLLTGRAADVLTVLDHFDVLSGSKMNHRPYTYARRAHTDSWTRIEGLLPAAQMARELDAALGSVTSGSATPDSATPGGTPSAAR